MRFKHTNRPGFWLGFIDFFTAGLFFLLYMPFGGLQEELDEILGRRTQRYWVAYLLGIPTAFIYPLIWMSRIAEDLKDKAVEMGIVRTEVWIPASSIKLRCSSVLQDGIGKPSSISIPCAFTAAR